MKVYLKFTNHGQVIRQPRNRVTPWLFVGERSAVLQTLFYENGAVRAPPESHPVEEQIAPVDVELQIGDKAVIHRAAEASERKNPFAGRAPSNVGIRGRKCGQAQT